MTSGQVACWLDPHVVEIVRADERGRAVVELWYAFRLICVLYLDAPLEELLGQFAPLFPHDEGGGPANDQPTQREGRPAPQRRGSGGVGDRPASGGNAAAARGTQLPLPDTAPDNSRRPDTDHTRDVAGDPVARGGADRVD